MGVAFVTAYYPEEAVAELARAFDVLGMVFLKLYPSYLGKPIDDEAYFPIFEWANEGRPVVRDGREVEAVHPYDAVWGRLLAPERRADLP